MCDVIDFIYIFNLFKAINRNYYDVSDSPTAITWSANNG